MWLVHRTMILTSFSCDFAYIRTTSKISHDSHPSEKLRWRIVTMDETLADNADPLVVRDKHVFIRGPVINFRVGSGDSQQDFAVHEKLFMDRFTNISDVPGFFHPERGTATDPIKLKGEDPEIFELYVQHLYTGDIPCRQAKYQFDMSYDYQNLMLVKFFALVNELCDETAIHPAFQAFLWSFRRLQKAGKPDAPSAEIMQYVYKISKKGSPLRELFVDMYIWEGKYDDSMSRWLPEAVTEIATAATMKWKHQSRADESEHTICCDYFGSNGKCRSRKKNRGERDGVVKKIEREETPEEGLA
ncbi:hypothetical protein HII31_02552 [Pseudocercospora fuligena]|uniref:BTB domain-containing protein n=1 Tax=Pseudocercospora fuligena TaxID=685502 RepID=A0A8H6RS49_9PEZI|nr:hypothetical protein HII31_02552 [Pseudocercospora fuligena]